MDCGRANGQDRLETLQEVLVTICLDDQEEIMTRGQPRHRFLLENSWVQGLGARSGCKVWVQGLESVQVGLKLASSEKDLKVPFSVYIEVAKSDICFSLHLLSGVACCVQVVVG